jgi:hypothetical protein
MHQQLTSHFGSDLSVQRPVTRRRRRLISTSRLTEAANSSPGYHHSGETGHQQVKNKKKNECAVIAMTDGDIQPHTIVIHTRHHAASASAILAPDRLFHQSGPTIVSRWASGSKKRLNHDL